MTGTRMAAALAAVALLAGAGCGASSSSPDGTKAGGGDPPLTLRMAHIDAGNTEPAVGHLVTTVAEVSDRNVQIQIARTWGGPEGERQIVEAVAAGEVDLGWVGTRALPDLGATSFQALTAPLLVDSYPLQQAILDSDIPARMLTGLEPLGVTGLAVVAGGLRKPLAANAPLRGPDDYAGITFHTWRAPWHAETIAALGAIHTDTDGGTRDDGLREGTVDGFENTLFFYDDLDARLAPYVTLNVSFWPRTGVVLANPDVLAGLTDAQRGWLQEAVASTAADSVEISDVDADKLSTICSWGARFAEASGSDLTALRQAVEPVYSQLIQDTATATFIAEIEALRSGVTVTPLTIPDGCAA